jgi:hypothetical protein
MDSLKFLSDNSNTWFISMLARFYFLFPFMLWLSWFFPWQVIFHLYTGHFRSYIMRLQIVFNFFFFGSWFPCWNVALKLDVYVFGFWFPLRHYAAKVWSDSYHLFFSMISDTRKQKADPHPCFCKEGVEAHLFTGSLWHQGREWNRGSTTLPLTTAGSLFLGKSGVSANWWTLPTLSWQVNQNSTWLF